MDFALLPPEINSGRMYTGPGSGPMLAAAAGWDTLTADLQATASAYAAVVTGLTSGPWLGPASASMAAAAAPFVAWMRTTAMQAEQAATQAKASASAYESAFAMTVPPPVIAANRSLLMSLIATNLLGQNTPTIAATEATYAEMWAQDAAAMYGYASSSAAASTLTPFTPPPPTTDPAGLPGQAGATAQAVSTPAGTAAQTIMSGGPQLLSAVPQALQGLASSAAAANPAQALTSVATLVTVVAIGVAGADTVAASFAAPASTFSGSASSASVSVTLRNIAALQAAREREAAAGIIRGGAPDPMGELGSEGPAIPYTGGTPAVSAGIGQAGFVGPLSVPRGWVTAAPAIRATALALPFTSTSAAPGAMAGTPGSLASSMALAGMAGSALGNTVSHGHRERVAATTPATVPATRAEPPQKPSGEPATGISTELRELALAVLRDSGDLTEEEFTEKRSLFGR
jgi:PPE-repeat protein